MSDIKDKTKSKKSKRSKAELLSLLHKYHQRQHASEKYRGYLIRNNLCDPAPMEGFRNSISKWRNADYNKID
jgi:hypothetical protein